MALPNFLVGRKARAAELAALVTELQNLFKDELKVVKPTDSPAKTNNTLAADPHLTLALEASTTYDFKINVYYTNTGTVADFKAALAFPSGAAVTWGGQRVVVGGGPTGDVDTGVYVAPTSAVSAISAGGFNGDSLITVVGTIALSTTPGNITLWWAQDTTTAANTIVRARSTLIARRFRSAP